MKLSTAFYLMLLTLFVSPVLAQYATQDTVHFAGEKYFNNVRQLTFGGDNAEAYWSYDGKSIVFQKQIQKKAFFVIKYLQEKFL